MQLLPGRFGPSKDPRPGDPEYVVLVGVDGSRPVLQLGKLDGRVRAEGERHQVGSFHDVLLVDGLVYAVGQTGNAGWLVAMSADGQLLWSEFFNVSVQRAAS